MDVERLTTRYLALVDSYSLRDATLLTMFLVVFSMFAAWVMADTPLVPAKMRRVLRPGIATAALVILLLTLGYSLFVGGGGHGAA